METTPRPAGQVQVVVVAALGLFVVSTGLVMVGCEKKTAIVCQSA